MITTRSRRCFNRLGSAVIPSVSGMPTSRITTSGSQRSICSMASRPLRSVATSLKSASASIQRANRPRTTTASSTTITRIDSGPSVAREDGWAMAMVIAECTTRLTRQESGRANRRSDQADFLELGLDDIPVERLHDVLVRPRMQRARDVGDVVLGGAEHHLGPIAMRHPAQRTQEFVAVLLRHVPIEKHRVGHVAVAGFKRLLAALALRNLEFESFENSPRHLADDAGIINDQTGLHRSLALYVRGRPRSKLSLQ